MERPIVKRAKTTDWKPGKAKTSPQEEMTHLGVIINLLLQMDRDARFRAVNYLVNRFNRKDAE